MTSRLSKIHKITIWGPIAIILLAVFFCGCEKKAPPPSPTVKIRSKTWGVELALTEKQRYRGLSGRESIPGDRGMLFVYPHAKNLSFCMRDCKIPIDIVFIGPNLRVINIYEMQVEPDMIGRVNYDSHLPALYALELAGGSAGLAGIVAGDLVEFTGIPDPYLADSGN